MLKVLIESPYAWDIETNVHYAKKDMIDCLSRWEAPYASHLLYTQVLNDMLQEERDLWIKAWLEWGNSADKTVVYNDLWISKWMEIWIQHAQDNNRPVEFRTIL